MDEGKGLFHCFVCGVGGDVVVLLAKLDGISNIEAARILMAQYGVNAGARFDAVWNEVKRWEPTTPLPTIELPASTVLNGYRGYSQEAIAHFGLRLVPNGVLIPFLDWGRPVGYAIRQVNRQPKYLNSEGFRKSDFLYGLSENMNAIIMQRVMIVCEGQFSAIRVWDAGYRNVVATMGASLSPAQAHLAEHCANKLIILYDGDEAGISGANKVREVYSSIFNIEIKHLKPGEDPDTGELSILGENNDRMAAGRHGEDVVQ